MKIILLGAPGVGKGTQAELICDHFNIPHISTGKLFRLNVAEGSDLGLQVNEYIKKGKLVPDYLTISLVEDRLNKDDCKNGFLLDGFPRDENQAKELELFLNKKGEHIDKVLLIEVSEKVILDRIAGRRVCPKCGESYNVKYNPSKVGDKCQVCGSELIQRSDDKEEVVLERLAIYNKVTKPIIDYYNALGVLYRIQGEDDINDIFKSILAILETD
ncbi:MAG: adenylate kinase [Eubacteriaceae bacterium]|nr:adenylate kinase [Eubacteriaceae bacterium]